MSDFDFDPAARGMFPAMEGFTFFDTHGYDTNGVPVTAVIGPSDFVTISVGEAHTIAKLDETAAKALVDFLNGFVDKKADEEEE